MDGDNPRGIDGERFKARLMDCVVGYLPRSCGVGPSGRGELVPPFLSLKSVSVHEARVLAARPDFRPWIEEAAGFHTYAFGQWQFIPRRKLS